MRSVLLGLLLAGMAQAGPPAFPGAEGFGAATPGGRGGRVLIVSNLNDSGPGSFREACAAKGPRVIVFRVAGIIDLQKPVEVGEPFVTIAGQSAPGGGICLRRYGLKIDTHDVIVRYLRSRPGDVAGDEVDAIAIGGDSRDVIVDHCSATWGVDEQLSPSGNLDRVTVQWSIIGEALNRSVHKKGPHGYGSLSRAAGGVTLHHNLWAHNTARNPRLGDNYGKPPFPVFDVRNNVMYDYGDMCSGMTGDRLSANYVGNYIRPGPSSNRKRGIIVLTKGADVRYYVAGNVVEGRPDLTSMNRRFFEPAPQDGLPRVEILGEPLTTPPVTATSAQEALKAVLEGVGATLPVRDAVDARMLENARTGKGRIIDSQKDVGGWPEYRSAPAPADSDGDGMPDAWEKARGLNPAEAGDAAGDRDGDGYTNIEEYLNGIGTQKGAGPARPRARK